MQNCQNQINPKVPSRYDLKYDLKNTRNKCRDERKSTSIPYPLISHQMTAQNIKKKSDFWHRVCLQLGKRRQCSICIHSTAIYFPFGYLSSYFIFSECSFVGQTHICDKDIFTIFLLDAIRFGIFYTICRYSYP